MNEPDGREPALRSYLLVVRRRRWVVALATALVVGAALAGSFLQTKQYTATAMVLLQPSSTPVPLAPNNNSTQQTLGTADIVTAQQLFSSTPVKNAVRAQLGSTPDVSIAQVAQTDVISVAGTSTNPGRSAEIANAYARAYVDSQRTNAVNDLLAAANQLQAKIADLDSQIATAKPPAIAALANQEALFKAELAQLQVNSALSTGGARVVTTAAVPTSPSSPRPVRNGLVALPVGLVLGLGLAFLLEHFDDSIKSKEDLDRVSPDLPVLGVVPVIATWKDTKRPLLVSQSAPSSPAAEAYRTIRTSLSFLGLEQPMGTILVTSPSANDGKTTTLANLAVALARAGQKTAIVSCDLRKPRVHDFLGVPNRSGFTSVLSGQEDISSALQGVPNLAGLSILASGSVPHNPAELLASEHTDALLGELANRFDTVLIDSPPVLPVADAVVLAGKVDATVVVVAAGHTGRKELARTLEVMSQVKASIVGFILNEVSREAGYGHSYYYRRYSYGRPPDGAIDLTRAGTNGGRGDSTDQPALPLGPRDRW